MEAFLELRAVLSTFQLGWQIAFPCATAKWSTLVVWAKKRPDCGICGKHKAKGIDGCQAGVDFGLWYPG